ncbi:MAG TPA: TIM barrel protein [Candidatus Aquilonibacter sp.]|nr:TIM barrel protein [Candidatus Aquilonibacter sp.]
MNRRDFAKTVAGVAAGSAFLPGSSAFAQAAASSLTPSFRFSVMLWTVFTDLPFDQRLDKVAQAGFKNVELTGEFSKWSDDDYTRFNAKKRELGMNFDATSGVRTGVADPTAGDKLIEEMTPFLDTMSRLECPKLILLSGNVIPGVSRDVQHDACIENLSRAADLAAKHNVSIVLENIDPEENPRYYLTSVAEGFEVIRRVNRPNVKFLYDFYHEQISEGNLIEKLQKNIDITDIVHIADVPGRHEPGTGEINYGNIFRKLGDLNFPGTVAMEFKPTGDAVASLSAAREMAIQSATATK